jgi:hypothetical protein
MLNRLGERGPELRPRKPDSIWERYLTGNLSVTDDELLPALITELHREIVAHPRSQNGPGSVERIEPAHRDLPPTWLPAPTTAGKQTPIIDNAALRAHIAKRRRIDSRQN